MSSATPNLESVLDLLADKIAARLAPTVVAPPAGKLLNVKQAAERIGRSAPAIRHLVNSGQIPARVVKRMGRRVFLVTEELDRWLDAQ